MLDTRKPAGVLAVRTCIVTSLHSLACPLRSSPQAAGSLRRAARRRRCSEPCRRVVGCRSRRRVMLHACAWPCVLPITHWACIGPPALLHTLRLTPAMHSRRRARRLHAVFQPANVASPRARAGARVGGAARAVSGVQRVHRRVHGPGDAGVRPHILPRVRCAVVRRSRQTLPCGALRQKREVEAG